MTYLWLNLRPKHVISVFPKYLAEGPKTTVLARSPGMCGTQMAWAIFSRNFYQGCSFKNCDRRHQPGLYRLRWDGVKVQTLLSTFVNSISILTGFFSTTSTHQFKACCFSHFYAIFIQIMSKLMSKM